MSDRPVGPPFDVLVKVTGIKAERWLDGLREPLARAWAWVQGKR